MFISASLWGEMEPGAITALVTGIGGLCVALGYAIRHYFPWRINMRKIDLEQSKRELRDSERRVEEKAFLIRQLADSLEGMYMISEEFRSSEEFCNRTLIMIYGVLQRQSDALRRLGEKTDPIPDLPKARAPDLDKLARARYLIGEGRQATTMLKESTERTDKNA